MKTITFNRNSVQEHFGLNNFTKNIDSIRNYRQLDMDSSTYAEGELQDVLATAPLVGDKDYVFFDTRVSFLMPGWSPSIPGWHTDGVPRGSNLNPAAEGNPSMLAQVEMDEVNSDFNRPRFHTICVGISCPTLFLNTPDYKISLEENDWGTSKLYESMTNFIGNPTQMDESELLVVENGVWQSWDWWNVHTAQVSNERGFRLLVRITETNLVKPRTDNFIRKHSQVYVPTNFGW